MIFKFIKYTNKTMPACTDKTPNLNIYCVNQFFFFEKTNIILKIPYEILKLEIKIAIIKILKLVIR